MKTTKIATLARTIQALMLCDHTQPNHVTGDASAGSWTLTFEVA